MTFFYDLNKKIADLAKPAEQLNEGVVAEKWGTETKVSPEEKGKYAGKTKDELLKSYNALKKSGPHKKGSPEFGRMRELAFAIRAKGDWGKVAEEGVEEGVMDTVKSAAQKALNVLGHGDDEAMIRDLQKKAGLPQTGKVPPQPQGQQPQGQQSNPMAEGDMEEGNAFSKAVVDAKKDGIQPGETIKVGGKTYPVKEGKGAKPDFLDVDKDGNRKESFKKAVADKKKGKEEVEESWDDMLKDVEKRRGGMKTGEKIQGHKGEIEKTATGIKHTRKYDAKTGETDTDDDEKPAGEKRGRGRPKKTDKAPERVTAKAYKHKGGRKMSKEEIEEAIATLEGHGYAVSRLDELSPETIASYQKKAYPQAATIGPKSDQRAAGVARSLSRPTGKGEQELDEKAVSQQQQKFMGMVHAMQKGEKIPGASKELKKVAREMPKKAAKDFAATKHAGLPKKVKKQEEVEETTTSGSVATATEAPKSKGKGGFTFGKGIYDSLNRELEDMIAESMNVSVNMSVDEHGEPHKNITVSAEGAEAEHLAQLLNLAGVAAKAQDEAEICPACGSADCGCNEEVVDENAPDWPTEPETTGADDPHLNRWAGGLNKPKETGQTTTPVVNRDPRRGSYGPAENPADVKEGTDLGMNLYREYKNYKAK